MADTTQTKVVLVEEEKAPRTELREALKKAGFEVAVCNGGFDALDELGSEGADIVVSSTSLVDVSGYQVCCLIKSNERGNKLPVVLLKGKEEEEDDFWKLAAMPDEYISADKVKDTKYVIKLIEKLAAKGKNDGWKRAMVKNFLVPSREFSTSNLVNSYAGLLDDLLIERLVMRITRTLTQLVEPKKRFVDAYYESINKLFNPDVLGIVIANQASPWAAFKIAPGLSQDAFSQLQAKIGKALELPQELSTEVQGELESGKGKQLGDLEILPVASDKNILGALVFGSYQKKSFNAISRAFMGQLQLQMQPVVHLLVAKQEIETLHTREAYRASTDPLTGLYNLEFLVGFLQQQLLFSFRQRLDVGMAIIDIDNFDKINEEYGYEIGDVVLTTIANRLLNITRSSDLIARYGGDEFAVVLPNTDVSGAKVLAEKIRLEVEQMGFVKGPGRKGPRVTISVGCSDFNMEDLNPETILRDAKIALQKAKEAGRNQVAVSAAG